MNRHVLDSFAWIEEMSGSSLGAAVRQMIEDEGNEIFTSSVSVAEVVSHAQRKGLDGRKVADQIEAGSVVVPMDFTLAVAAGRIHAETSKKIKDFPLGDAAVIALARAMKAKIVTGDRHFRGLPETLFLG